MVSEGQIVLFRFPQTNQAEGKLRPALVIRQLPGPYDDWLICMITSQLDQGIPDFDEIITPNDLDFHQTGLKLSSLVRIARIAVVRGDILLGKLGQIDPQRLRIIKHKICNWIQQSS